MAYNIKYFDGNSLWQLRPKKKAIHTYILSNGIILAMFQGSRGAHPDLDFVVKIMKEGANEKPFAPEHVLWVADVIIKSQHFPTEIREIIDYYINYYDNVCKPFDTVDERAAYIPTTVNYISTKYGHVVVFNTLPIDYIAHIIELFCICEKRNEGAYMFRDLLHSLKDYIDGNVDYMTVLRYNPDRRY